MTTELRFLDLAIVLGFIHIIAASHAASLQRGYRWTASARDNPAAPLTGVAGRLERALRNFLETFPFFAGAVVVAHLINVHTPLTIWGAHLYFWGRLVYLPLYVFGVPLIRSLVWNVASAGIACLVASALLS